jgi:hypothetical protein
MTTPPSLSIRKRSKGGAAVLFGGRVLPLPDPMTEGITDGAAEPS